MCIRDSVGFSSGIKPLLSTISLLPILFDISLFDLSVEGKLSGGTGKTSGLIVLFRLLFSISCLELERLEFCRIL